MAHFETSRSLSHSAVLAEMISRSAYELVARITAWNNARRTRNSLLSLSNHELDDIGLCRGDIDDLVRGMRF